LDFFDRHLTDVRKFELIRDAKDGNPIVRTVKWLLIETGGVEDAAEALEIAPT